MDRTYFIGLRRPVADSDPENFSVKYAVLGFDSVHQSVRYHHTSAPAGEIRFGAGFQLLFDARFGFGTAIGYTLRVSRGWCISIQHRIPKCIKYVIRITIRRDIRENGLELRSKQFSTYFQRQVIRGLVVDVITVFKSKGKNIVVNDPWLLLIRVLIVTFQLTFLFFLPILRVAWGEGRGKRARGGGVMNYDCWCRPKQEAGSYSNTQATKDKEAYLENKYWKYSSQLRLR